MIFKISWSIFPGLGNSWVNAQLFLCASEVGGCLVFALKAGCWMFALSHRVKLVAELGFPAELLLFADPPVFACLYLP